MGSEGRRGLVVVVPTAATATTAITTAAAASTTTAAAATTTAAAAGITAASTTTTTAAATAPLRLTRHVDDDAASAKLFAVEVGDRGLGLVFVAHFDEGEAARPARVAISDNFDLGDLTSAATFEESLD